MATSGKLLNNSNAFYPITHSDVVKVKNEGSLTAKLQAIMSAIQQLAASMGKTVLITYTNGEYNVSVTAAA